MGMFDRISFRSWDKWFNKFPESQIEFLFDEEWQTKSLENSLNNYIVEDDGSLTEEGFTDDYYSSDKKVKPYYFHGEVYAHTYVSSKDDHFIDDPDSEGTCSSAEIKLVFTKGYLEEVELISFEKDKPIPKFRKRNLIDHIKEIVDIDTITIPTRFMVYGFDITLQDNNKWSITRANWFSVMRDFSIKEGVHADYESYIEAHNFIIKFFELVKEDKITHPFLEERN